jgi:hypothetical protein
MALKGDQPVTPCHSDRSEAQPIPERLNREIPKSARNLDIFNDPDLSFGLRSLRWHAVANRFPIAAYTWVKRI